MFFLPVEQKYDLIGNKHCWFETIIGYEYWSAVWVMDEG
jgi:hypothetical protein